MKNQFGATNSSSSPGSPSNFDLWVRMKPLNRAFPLASGSSGGRYFTCSSPPSTVIGVTSALIAATTSSAVSAAMNSACKPAVVHPVQRQSLPGYGLLEAHVPLTLVFAFEKYGHLGGPPRLVGAVGPAGAGWWTGR